MLTVDLSATQITFFLRVFYTLLLFTVFILMSTSYTQKRFGKKYARSKDKAPSINSFKTLSKVLFVSSMLITLYSFWFSSKLLLNIHQNIYLQGFGVLIIVTGYLKLSNAFTQLGDNYSPLFDAYQPYQIISQGAYRVIRHPIYLYNLFVSFGLALASGSLLVLINAIIGLFFVLKAIHLEEDYLTQTFNNYKTYKTNTWKLIPFIY